MRKLLARETKVAFAFFIFYIMYDKLASAIYNDIYSGLRGLHHNMSLTMEQLIDDIIDERMQILKEYTLKGIIPF